MSRPRGTDEAKIIQVIRTKALVGAGSETDPCGIVTQYWDFDGKLLAEDDPKMELDTETTHAYKKVLGHLLDKYQKQILELYSREECVDDLVPVLTDLGISDTVLDKFRM